MRQWIQVITLVLLLGYPLAVYFGLNYLPSHWVALILASLLLLRLATQRQQIKALALPVIMGVLLMLGSAIAKQQHWLLYYPVMMNLFMLAIFAISLLREPCMIERFARITEPDLPASARPYLRKVTLLWCGLFIINGGAATYTAVFSSLQTWTLYNGLIAYILIGMLAGGEWLYRHFWLKQS